MVILFNFIGYIAVMSALTSLVFLLFGDQLIKSLNLDTKYPKLAKYIKHRQGAASPLGLPRVGQPESHLGLEGVRKQTINKNSLMFNIFLFYTLLIILISFNIFMFFLEYLL